MMLKSGIFLVLVILSVVCCHGVRSGLGFDTPMDYLDYNITYTNDTINFTPEVNFLLYQYHDGVPHSYYVPDGYWRSKHYIPEHLHPRPLFAKRSILDRTLTKYGLNLYDGSTWEIGLALEGEHEVQIAYESLILYQASSGCDNSVGGLCDLKGDGSTFLYGKNQVPGSSLKQVPMPGNGNATVSGSYFFRMISNTYITEDPLIGSYSPAFMYPKICPSCDPWNTFGVIVWDDWKPITGENVWGTMIGPIQRYYLYKNGTMPMWNSFAEAPAPVQLALSILPALMALQSDPGSLYHCPSGSDIIPPDSNEGQNVSNENNASGLAAISILLEVLKNNTINYQSSDLSPYITDLTNLQSGLINWFKQYGLAPPIPDTGFQVFYQGGHVNFTGGTYYPVPIDSYGGFAVDCQTWVTAVLGVDFVDNTLGSPGTAYNIWQQTKKYSAHYGKDGSLAGVGYTIHPLHDIWSAEWSFGAVLMTRVLSYQYSQMSCANCQQYASDLLADAQSMYDNLIKPISEGGLHAEITVPGVEKKMAGFLYCNQRYSIPWGWYANPLPSICSTSWYIFMNNDYNPFVLGGGQMAPLQF
eukprot:TRINITY_DN395_c0_g1_i1.p1 TRINITY_DN395_c0_g1~~TRINITY_DN395_c0_g1_i1.p1  ORF type:complete len:584 (-),score=218.08 TRINITY_DN395_c0_g1_i1:200-1951(-)